MTTEMRRYINLMEGSRRRPAEMFLYHMTDGELVEQIIALESQKC